MKKTIYIAESDRVQREELVLKLGENSAFQVIGQTENGITAQDEIKKLEPDTVVLSLALPALDGFGVIEKIRESGVKTKIIVVSALSGQGFITRAMEMGASYYMVKPVDYEVLGERILSSFEERKITKRADKSVDERISNIFMSVGIPAHIKGYQFLREAIKLAVQNPDIINSITKGLYPSIALRYDTTASKVERAIRHAIEVAWNKGRIENINNLFGVKIYTPHDKPTNGEFIALVADKMLIEQI